MLKIVTITKSLEVVTGKAGALESASSSDGLVITDLKRRRMEDHGKKVETGGP